MYYEKEKKIIVKPVFNKKNGQINFSLNKKKFSKDFKKKLPSLRGIEIKMEDFYFD